MIEVFKANITKQKESREILEKLNQTFPKYKINFDLENCDNILRIENPSGEVHNDNVIQLINNVGFFIEPLTNEFPAAEKRIKL
ncbi:hypothetical protein CSW08_13040 [Confluentibacter flavum]|uniref:Methyltransferase type 11 n=2 Tax=Confluentibacter flavum TaxID=1909700 RepID=A0A2N3HI62_9FLAO|nr:hypothetical protein CSW08_13040 [Confluentibacter flavum]